MDEQKERAEKELKFLEESLTAGVITRDEYEEGKERIEQKLKEISSEKIPETQADLKDEDESPISESQQEKIEIKELKDKQDLEIEKSAEEQRIQKRLEEQQEKEAEEIIQEEKELPKEEQKIEEQKPEIKTEEPEPKEGVKINKKALFAICIIILIVIFFWIRISNIVDGGKATAGNEPLCVSDDDCKKKGKVGICQNPDTVEANCSFKDPVAVDLTIITDKNCVSCDTARMKQVLKQLFLGARINEIDYNTNSGKKLADEFDIDVLPAYIFGADLNKTHNFLKTERAFLKKGDSYIMLPTATGADYFFRRENIPNKLDLFVLPGEDKNKNNIAEVLALFENEINFEKHELADQEKIKDELAITTTPVFLVNNQLKFGGIQSAEAIKERFCELNNLEVCSVTLSQDIK